MQRVIWIVAGIGFLLWSLLAWLGYAVLGWVGDFTASNAGRLTAGAEMSEWLAWAAEVIGAAGGTLIVILWLFGSAAIAVMAFGASWLLRRHEAPHTAALNLPPGRRR